MTKIKKIAGFIIRKIIGEYYFSINQEWRWTKRKLTQYYSLTDRRATNDRKMVIYMADGRIQHGGLSDRLRAMTSVYVWCRKHDIDFKINFVSPFPLELFLIPNQYDWRISPQEISYNRKDSKPVTIMTRRRDSKNIHEKLIQHYSSLNYKQIHLYTDFDIDANMFQETFKVLFKPTLLLEKHISDNIDLIGTKYIAIAFRFLQLLGDFKEPSNCHILNQEEKNILINKCTNVLLNVYRNYSNQYAKILVTSDSCTFLASISHLDFIYTIPGEICHIDVAGNDSYMGHLKTFVDLFMLSKADSVYLVVAPGMYHSGFPKRAALISGIPFQEIIIT